MGRSSALERHRADLHEVSGFYFARPIEAAERDRNVPVGAAKTVLLFQGVRIGIVKYERWLIVEVTSSCNYLIATPSSSHLIHLGTAAWQAAPGPK
jgi:hypothetical protein